MHGKTTSDIPVVQNDMTILLVSRECLENQFYNKTQPHTEVQVENVISCETLKSNPDKVEYIKKAGAR